MLKWSLLLSSGLLFGSTGNAVLGTLALVAGIVDV
jgi:hypothetical protein